MRDRFYLLKESKMHKKRKELFLTKFYLRKKIFITAALKILFAERALNTEKSENSKSAKRHNVNSKSAKKEMRIF